MRNALVIFLALAIVVSAAMVFTADAQLTTGERLPASTGFAAQGAPTGALGQGQAGGFAGGALNQPGQGAGITFGEGELMRRPLGQLPGTVPGGQPTCACVAAPCYCPPTTGTLPQGPFGQSGQSPVTAPIGQGQPQGIPFNPAQSGVLPPAGTGQPGAGQFIRR